MRYNINNGERTGRIKALTEFKSGRMRGTTSPPIHTGRLPANWRSVYMRDISDIVYVVISYDTPIAWMRENVNGTRTWFYPAVTYSSYTSRHCHHVFTAIVDTRYVRGDRYMTPFDIGNQFDKVTRFGDSPHVYPNRKMIAHRTTRSVKNGDQVMFTGFGWCTVYDKFKRDDKWYVATWISGTRYLQEIESPISFLR